MPADGAVGPIGPDYHRHSVPANNAFDPSFNLTVARKGRLAVGRNSIHIRSIVRNGQVNSVIPGFTFQLGQYIVYPR